MKILRFPLRLQALQEVYWQAPLLPFYFCFCFIWCHIPISKEKEEKTVDADRRVLCRQAVFL